MTGRHAIRMRQSQLPHSADFVQLLSYSKRVIRNRLITRLKRMPLRPTCALPL